MRTRARTELGGPTSPPTAEDDISLHSVSPYLRLHAAMDSFSWGSRDEPPLNLSGLFLSGSVACCRYPFLAYMGCLAYRRGGMAGAVTSESRLAPSLEQNTAGTGG